MKRRRREGKKNGRAGEREREKGKRDYDLVVSGMLIFNM